ncbi:GreA/GreB family elongation factor [Candidatus Acetothermia bacterium]|jgi:transcription elongation factor GreA|nr:GreA/GreB family elongation factor [Candidatus Acetothermia bacterium]MCI2426487.1 GreA/GreB family elongation factor [Candidatus Acetothermia bacterium]MCI2426926.1 GreA/GreB family elongation factor [Candidatus Acetothermia bacterium]MCI2428881.1 GreA/GreB family elongation factor [Candidatus Acetothermia bacterium]
MQNSDRILLTKEGYELMKQEMDSVKKILYEEIPEKLKVAKLHGGEQRENKEYIYLQSEQDYYVRELKRLTSLLDRAEIIPDDEISREKIGIGTRLVLQDLSIKESGDFTLVSPAEVDLERGKISVDSPVGSALLGKRENDTLTIAVPAGKVRFKILSIHRQ